MPWKPWQVLCDVLASWGDLARLERVYSLTRFFANGIYPPDYQANPSIVDIIALSPEGHEAAVPALAEFPGPDVRLAVADYFSHHDLLIDPAATNVEALEDLIVSELRSGRLFLPMRFGRLLYDRFNEDPASDAVDHLTPAQTLELLHDTPIGVYQLGWIVSGPEI